MKTTYIKKLIYCTVIGLATSCSLDYDPLSDYSDVTIGSDEDEDNDDIKFKTREEMLTQYNGMYNRMRDNQEHWYLDYLLFTEVRSDNAYGGTTGSNVVGMETNGLDGSGESVERSWNRYLTDIATANKIIDNVDKVPDQSFTSAERARWKAEAKVYRAMIMFDMVRFWGNFPVITQEAEDITSENITEVYPVYFPEQNTIDEAYEQILLDLTEALPDVPENDATNKTLMSKGVVYSLLTKVYAEKPVQDYSKVIQYADQVINGGYSLVSDFEDLFGLNEAGTDVRMRNSSESIFELSYPVGSGNWVTWMLGRNLLNWDQSFSWAKWITPSRDLIRTFESEGDQIRLNQSVVYYASTWSNYYPADHYAFMYKCRSEVNSIIKLRLADIMLMKAEALIMQGDLAGAAGIINTIRARVNLAPLASSVTGSKDQMINALLKERRLELAFEGTRWFDLIRLDKLQEVMNGINNRDSGRLPQVNPFTEFSELFPIPQSVLDQNVNLVQNPGY